MASGVASPAMMMNSQMQAAASVGTFQPLVPNVGGPFYNNLSSITNGTTNRGFLKPREYVAPHSGPAPPVANGFNNNNNRKRKAVDPVTQREKEKCNFNWNWNLTGLAGHHRKAFLKWCWPKVFACHMCESKVEFEQHSQYLAHLQTVHKCVLKTDSLQEVGLWRFTAPKHTCKLCYKAVKHDGWTLFQHLNGEGDGLHKKGMTLETYFTDHILPSLPSDYGQDWEEGCGKTPAAAVSDEMCKEAAEITHQMDADESPDLMAWANSCKFQCKLCQEVSSKWCM